MSLVEPLYTEWMIQVPSKSTPTGFQTEAGARIREAQAAVIELLDGAGLGGARPTDVGRELGLDKTLAWKISKFAQSTDLVKAAKHVPGNGGIEITLRAAALKGVTEDRIDAVRAADRALREFVRKQAGDRRSFEAMLAAGGRDERIEIEERRDFYRSGSAIWGVRAKSQLLALVLRPSETDPDRIDVAQLSGFIGFERLRSDVPWIIRRLWASDSEGTQEAKFEREPLDPTGVTGTAIPLIPEFCTQPLPEVNQFKGSDGVLYDELAPGLVGRRGAINCISGEIYRSAIPLAWSADNTTGRYELNLRTPVEFAQFDIYLHESLTNFGDFEQGIYGLIEDRPGIGSGKTHKHPMYTPQPAKKLGFPAMTHSSKISNYAKMIEGVLDRARWGKIDAFRGYRIELEYPATPWCLTMTCEIRKDD